MESRIEDRVEEKIITNKAFENSIWEPSIL